MTSQYYWSAECHGGEVIYGFDEEEVCASSRLIAGKKVKNLFLFSVLDEAVVLQIAIPVGCHPAIVFSRCMSRVPGGKEWEEPELQRFGWEDRQGRRTLFVIEDGELVRSNW